MVFFPKFIAFFPQLSYFSSKFPCLLWNISLVELTSDYEHSLNHCKLFIFNILLTHRVQREGWIEVLRRWRSLWTTCPSSPGWRQNCQVSRRSTWWSRGFSRSPRTLTWSLNQKIWLCTRRWCPASSISRWCLHFSFDSFISAQWPQQSVSLSFIGINLQNQSIFLVFGDQSLGYNYPDKKAHQILVNIETLKNFCYCKWCVVTCISLALTFNLLPWVSCTLNYRLINQCLTVY